MKIADLFVQLGTKGTEKSVASLNSISKGIQGIILGSTAVTASLLGSVYALKRLGDQSSHEGTTLKNFNSITGLSTKTLQQYQYAARQAGASNEEMTSTITGLQQKMAQMKMTGEVSKGFSLIASTVGVPENLNDTFALFQKLQDFVQKFKNDPNMRDVIGSVLGDFGVSGNIAAAMFEGKFNEDVFKKAQVYSDSQIKSLDSVRAGWDNLGRRFETMLGRLNVKFGNELIKTLDALLPKVESIVSSFARLADNLQVFKLIGKSMEGWSMIFDELSSSIESVPKISDNYADYMRQSANSRNLPGHSSYTINNQQTMNFNGQVTDPREVGKATGIATKEAWKESAKGTASNLNSRGRVN